MPRRVPLFSVSVAFASGCLLGLDGLGFWPEVLGVWVVLAGAWVFARGREKISLLLFLLLVAAAGWAHTLLAVSSVAPGDLRRLPDEKLLATTQWRARVMEEPVAQASPHLTRRRLDRTTFVVEVEAWRPTEGRFFGDEIDLPWRSAEGRVSCTVLGPAQEIAGGDEIEFAAPLTPIAGPLAPGQFDFRGWSAANGVYYEATLAPRDWQRHSSGHGFWWSGLSYRLRDWAYARLQAGLEDDPRTADFLAGMLIGYRQEIPADIEQDFRRTGTLHVFAISGQNIAEMLVVAVILLQLVGLVRWRWAWLLVPVVLLYCLLAGSPASAVRATVMALSVLLAWRLGRPLDALACWSVAFLALLVWNPAVLLDPGAQLSFAVVLGLILIAPPIYRILARIFSHDPFLPRDLLSPWQRREERAWTWLVGLLAASIAATLVSEPIAALDFHQVTPISVVANLLVVPLAGLITVVGTISVASSLVCPPVSALFNNANWAFAKILILLVHLFAVGPGAALNVPDLRVVGAATPFFAVAPVQSSACLLVRTGQSTWLVDTGREAPVPSIPERLLQFYGINRLDGLILAQESAPDNGGAALIVRRFRPRRLIVPAVDSRSPLRWEIPELAAAAGVKPERWARGGRFILGPDVQVDVLGPATDGTSTREENSSLLLLFRVRDRTLLWAGHLDPGGQTELRQAFPGLRVDILCLAKEALPGDAFLQALGDPIWLQYPPRQPHLNLPGAVKGSGKIWPLEETGAVTIRVAPASPGRPAATLLQPWVALPK